MKFFKFLPLVFLALYFLIVFKPFIFAGQLPVPADTIVGLYHPWRDAQTGIYPSGVPFKNFLITDPVRQQYPWREMALEALRKGQLSKWNPYSFAGTPLLANIQTAAFYPLNFVYFLLPFSWGWSLQVVSQVLLGGLLMIFYLRHLKLSLEAQALGALAWVGSGFFVAWLEWNTLVQVAIWLPLIFLSIDKILAGKRSWSLVFVFSLAASFLAGHLQIFFYVALISAAYAAKDILPKRNWPVAFWFLFLVGLWAIATSIQWWPMVTFFAETVRTVPATSWQNPEWFLPWQNLVQLIAPDFFGNPATGNYFGLWNYGEFVGYVGIVPLTFALFSLWRKEKRTIFWIVTLAVSLLFALPTFISSLPFRLSLPLVSIAQPTRLLVLADFSLAILAAYGFDAFVKETKFRRQFLMPTLILLASIVLLYLVALGFHLSVSQKNLILPTALITATVVLLIFSQRAKKIVVLGLLAITLFDLSRFMTKFESFSSPSYLFPETGVTRFLADEAKDDVFRVVALDDRIFPPNFSVHYKIQMVSGYDSMVLSEFANLYGSGSRITVPKNIDDPNFALLGVRYFLTFSDLDPKKYQLVFQEGQTKVFEARRVLPRALFASPSQGFAKISKYTENEVMIQTYNPNDGLLNLLDAFYPEWQAEIDGQPAVITPSDTGFFRVIFVPKGTHTVRFKI